jgi:hypothetical protein
MALKATQIAVPSDGTPVQVVDDDGDLIPGQELGVRNTGTVDLLVGGPSSCLMPLKVDEYLGLSMDQLDVLYVKVKTAGTIGQLTALKTG